MKHPNKLPFRGVLAILDVPSDVALGGSLNHRCILPRETAEAALHTLLGMAVNFAPSWNNHDPRRKCGVITAAHIEYPELIVEGHLFAKDFPEIKSHLQQHKMGMSYEVTEAKVRNPRATIWTLDRVTFTGAAILHQDKAAYKSTSFKLR